MVEYNEKLAALGHGGHMIGIGRVGEGVGEENDANESPV